LIDHSSSSDRIFCCQDAFLDFYCYGDSFETSVPWDKCEQLCINTKAAINTELKKYKVPIADVSCRVTQLYDAGACVYFYVLFRDKEMKNPLEFFERIEDLARKTILASGECQTVFCLEEFSKNLSTRRHSIAPSRDREDSIEVVQTKRLRSRSWNV
jgi:FAD linked oxidases, C-terminal domain